MKPEPVEEVFVENLAALHQWLREHHSQTASVWLCRWKKGKGDDYLAYTDLVDELLCWGWVDSLPRSKDAYSTLIRISPRQPKSHWSAINKAKVERLLQEGRMQPSGMRMVEMAKANGQWDFLNDVEQLQIPEDLEQAFQALPEARMYFDRFPKSSQRGILEWIKSAKQPATRQKRIAQTVEKAAQNRKANHPTGRDAGPKKQ